MSSSAQSPLPSSVVPFRDTGDQAATTLSADGRIRVLCPKGIDPQASWPGGARPLMAYVVYAPLTFPLNPNRTS